jgi:hypothetical protein
MRNYITTPREEASNSSIQKSLDTGPHWKLKNRRLYHYTNNTVSK